MKEEALYANRNDKGRMLLYIRGKTRVLVAEMGGASANCDLYMNMDLGLDL